MKLKIKKSYKINGKTIKVKVVDTHDFAGLWDPQKMTIYLSANQSEDSMQETFWHEWNHYMQWESGVNQAVSRELMEVMAEKNSRTINAIIKQS